jgi:WD40 repeat protein
VFSPDGQRIVTASWDHTARIYRVVTLSDLAELLGK